MDKPKLIEGGSFVDDRGFLKYFNGFDPKELGIRRFYQTENFQKGFIRAWHGHLIESKWIYVPRGTILAGVVRIRRRPIHDEMGIQIWVDVDDQPYKKEEPETFVISSQNPSILYVPAGYANGVQNLEDNTCTIYFSDKT